MAYARKRSTRRSTMRKPTTRRSRTTRKTAVAKRKRSTTNRRVVPRKRAKPLTLVDRSIHKMHHPFSRMTDQPKIPDDSCVNSLSRSLRNVSQVRNAEEVDVMHVLFYAGLGIGCTIFGAEETYGPRPQKFLGFPNSQLTMDGTDMQNAEDGVNAVLKHTEKCTHLRTVSTGMKVTLNNVPEESDGWVEVVRIKDDQDLVSDWCLASVDDTQAVDFTECGLGARTSSATSPGMDAKLASIDMVNQPGYEKFLLRDIHKKEFRLNPVTNCCRWRQLSTDYQLTKGDENDFSYNGYQVMDFKSNNAKTKDAYSALMDSNFDMIYLRIHPRKHKPESNKFAGSSMIFELAQNNEFQMAPESNLKKFQTMGLKHPKIDHIIGKMNDDISPTKSPVG